MVNLIQCTNTYTCFEGLLEFLITIFFLFYQIISYRIIMKDKSGTLVQIDRLLCIASIIQTILQVAYFLYFDNDTILSTIRCIGIAQQVILCNILGSIIANEEQINFVWLLARILLGITFILWFWSGIAHRSIIDYNCVQIDYLILSFFGFILACGAFYMGNIALGGLIDCKDRLEVAKNNQIQMRQYNAQLEQVIVRIEQITLMQYCGLLQYSFQFIFDLFTFFKCDIATQCETYYNAQSFIMIILLPIYKVIIFSTIPVTIFWIFYEKNKSRFNEYEDNINVEMSESK